MSSTFVCPHCGAESDSAGVFCHSCGKALPSVQQTGPRVIGTHEFAATFGGQKLQIGELQRQLKKAGGALLTVAIIQTVVGVIAFMLQQAVANRARLGTERIQNLLMILTIAAFAVAAAFFCLYSWSQTQPLPAAIVGLVIYGTLVCLNVFITLSNSSPAYSSRQSSFHGIGVGWVDFVIIGILIRAISAGTAYNKLLNAGAADPQFGAAARDAVTL